MLPVRRQQYAVEWLRPDLGTEGHRLGSNCLAAFHRAAATERHQQFALPSANSVSSTVVALVRRDQR